MHLLSLLINLMHHWQLKVLLSFKNWPQTFERPCISYDWVPKPIKTLHQSCQGYNPFRLTQYLGLIMSSKRKQKRTQWAVTMPGPIALFSILPLFLSILMRASAARTSHSTPLHNEGARRSLILNCQEKPFGLPVGFGAEKCAYVYRWEV